MHMDWKTLNTTNISIHPKFFIDLFLAMPIKTQHFYVYVFVNLQVDPKMYIKIKRAKKKILKY